MIKDWSNRSLKENEYVPRSIILSGRRNRILLSSSILPQDSEEMVHKFIHEYVLLFIIVYTYNPVTVQM